MENYSRANRVQKFFVEKLMTSPPQQINYEQIMHGLRISLVRQVLEQVSKQGLIGNHFFQLTINTQEKGIEIPNYLLEQYPEQIVIVLQHRFENLTTNDQGFAVTLYFQGSAERIFVPWQSVLIFQDPSAPFGLQIKNPSHTPSPSSDNTKESVSRIPSATSAATSATDKQNKQPQTKKSLKIIKSEKGKVLAFETWRGSDKPSEKDSTS